MTKDNRPQKIFANFIHMPKPSLIMLGPVRGNGWPPNIWAGGRRVGRAAVRGWVMNPQVRPSNRDAECCPWPKTMG